MSARPEHLPDLPMVGNQRKWNVAKLVIRAISLTFEVAVIGMSIYPSLVDAIIPVGFALIWDATEIIKICIRRDLSKGVKIGAHVGCDLILFLGMTVVTIWMAISTWTYQEAWYGYRDSSFYQTYWTEFLLMVAICPFVAMITLLHFTLFVRACIEVHRRRKDRRIQQLVMAMIANGHTPTGNLDLAQTTHEATMPSSEAETVLTSNEVASHEANPDKSVGNISSQKELPLAPEDLGINEKVLLDDIIRQMRGELNR